jgi:hypothetical protein
MRGVERRLPGGLLLSGQRDGVLLTLIKGKSTAAPDHQSFWGTSSRKAKIKPVLASTQGSDTRNQSGCSLGTPLIQA